MSAKKYQSSELPRPPHSRRSKRLRQLLEMATLVLFLLVTLLNIEKIPSPIVLSRHLRFRLRDDASGCPLIQNHFLCPVSFPWRIESPINMRSKKFTGATGFGHKTGLIPSLRSTMMPLAQIEQRFPGLSARLPGAGGLLAPAIRAEQLQAEMERMARQTGQPEVLREIFAALENDPFVIAECLARPTLSERSLTELYSQETGRVGPFKSRKASVEKQMAQGAGTSTVGYALPAIWGDGLTRDIPGATNSPDAPTPTPGCADAWAATSTTNAPSARQLYTAIWTGSEMIVWGGDELGPDTNTAGNTIPARILGQLRA